MSTTRRAASAEILQGESESICEAANRPASLIELGSGSARKTRVLLDAMRGRGLPGDLLPRRHLRGDHPRDRGGDRRRVRGRQRPRPRLRLRIRPRAGAGRGPRDDRAARRDGRQLRAAPARGFPDGGSRTCSDRRTASCSEPTWSRIRRSSRRPTTTQQGVTAEFNKNVLAVLNRELGADFDLESFEHVARWDPENLWVDIRLRSLANQVVNFERARHARPVRAPARR